jgi:hypothetical protein
MPYFRKVERAKSVIENGRELFSKTCPKCSAEFYGEEKQTKCETCGERKEGLIHNGLRDF